MKRFVLALGISIAWSLAMTIIAFAQTPLSSIPGGKRIEYRLDYAGDGSAIKVVATETDVNNLVISIYTSDQIEAVRRGEVIKPTGLATRTRDDTLQWSGGFRSNGVYYVVVENRAGNALTYRLTISGDGVSGVARIAPSGPPISTQIINQNGQRTLMVNLPPGTITQTLQLNMPADPGNCTPPTQVPNPINKTIKLCPGQTYAPMNIVGNNIALLADDAHSAVITSSGRQYAVTMDGANNWIEGITIQASAASADLGAWLCMYDECLFATKPVTTTLHGGIQYGGGILLKGTDTTIHGVTVRGGTIGIATVNGRNNKLIENNLSDLNGWGSFNVASQNSYFVGNYWNHEDHACVTPDGKQIPNGCEAAGWNCLACTANIIARNSCEDSANCFYMSGERNLASNQNSFLSNFCAGASANCFEITFSFGNILQDNMATYEPKSNKLCKYPFWVGGSVVFFANNVWECSMSEDTAFNQSRDSTTIATNIIRLDNTLGALNAPRIDATPSTNPQPSLPPPPIAPVPALTLPWGVEITP